MIQDCNMLDNAKIQIMNFISVMCVKVAQSLISSIWKLYENILHF